MGSGLEMNECGQFMKYGLFIENLILFVGGFVVTGLGIWISTIKVEPNELIGTPTNLYYDVLYLFIAVGLIIAVIAFLGCFGAIRELRWMLLMYFIIVTLIFITLFVIGVLCFLYKDELASTVTFDMKESMNEYEKNETITRAWDEMQKNLKCCGVTHPQDWSAKKTFPKSCCKDTLPENTACNNGAYVYSEGCLKAAEKYLERLAFGENGAAVWAIVITVACLMIFAMVFSFALVFMIKS